MFPFGPLRIQDSANVLKESWGALINYQCKYADGPAMAAPPLANLHPDARGATDTLDLLLRNMRFPYNTMIGHAVFNQPAWFPIEACNNDLTGEVRCDKDHALFGKSPASSASAALESTTMYTCTPMCLL